MVRLTFILTGFALTRFTYGAIERRDNQTVASDVKHPQVQWGLCDPTVIQNPAISCTYFEVPMDYHDPSVGYARLAVAKANATGERRGTLFVNPGGPGISGLEIINANGSQLVSLTGGIFDVVSWDPRGVGSLTFPGEIYCFDSVAEYNTFFNGTIELTGIEMTGNFTDPEDINDLLSQAPIMQHKYEETANKCINHTSGKFLKYVGTAAAVRDMVSMTDAFDGPGAPVNYYGISYGTILGSWFLNMFPERVGRVILDGVINPNILATEEIALGWSKELTSSDDVYNGFVTGCALAGPEGCDIASAEQSAAQVNDNIQALLQAAHDATRANSSVLITSGEIRQQLSGAMYSPSEWSSIANQVYPQIAAEVKQESQRNVTRRSISTPRKMLRKRQANDTIPYTEEAIFCGDSVDPKGTTMAEIFDNIIATSQNASHMFGAVWPVAVYYCSSWPVRAVERYQGPFNKTLANRILVIGNTYDPVTPFAGAQAVAALFGDQATLVRMNGFGHVSVAEPSTCILEIAAAYLINGTLPEGNDTVCEVDADFEVFDGVNIAQILENLSDIVV